MQPGKTHTTCPYCGVGCGVVADGTDVKGDSTHPSNHGRLCSKGAALAQTLGFEGRLTTPKIHGAPADWDTALDLIAAKFSQTIAAHGPQSVAFYISGQLLTEDYYVVNKLAKGFLGTANVDSNSRLCMASAVAGHIRAFGEDVVPGVYEDFDQSDLVVLVGSNTAWCHPVLHQRLMAAKDIRGTRIVVIDPRRTATAEAADLHLPIAPGSDVILFLGLLAYLDNTRALNAAWLDQHVGDTQQALRIARAQAGDMQDVAAQCGIDPEALEDFYESFRATERVMTVFSQGVNQSSSGTDKVNAIINVHLATGRIGRAGMGPFSVTGQPNAMGGREVGGLANQLAAHLNFTDAQDRDLLRRFWQAPHLAAKPGLKAVDLFEAVGTGQIKAIWIVATNPADSMPRAQQVRAALQACPFVVVSDAWETDTTQLAHIVLPAASWGEKDGTVTSSERRISRQRAFRTPPGAARPDWWCFTQLAQRMGFGAYFNYQGPADIFREHAALSGFENTSRLFNIGALARLSDADYDRLEPVRWPYAQKAAGEGGRLFAKGGFSTPDGRARMVPTPYAGGVARTPGSLLLNTGRVRDHWHTMTRTGLVASLAAHTPEPLLAIHPADARAHGFSQGDFARITTAHGQAILRIDIKHSQRHGEVFAPMHWTDQFATGGPVGQLVTAKNDPLSGQPDLKATVASVERCEAHFHGVLLAPRENARPHGCHWVRVPQEQGELYRLTGFADMPQGAALGQFVKGLLPDAAQAERIEMSDRARGISRVALVQEGRLFACVALAKNEANLPPVANLAPLLGRLLTTSDRAAILAGGARGGTDEGPHICACFGVSRGAIRHAIATKGLVSVAEIGDALRAGTNCGSCKPELQQMLAEIAVAAF